jgi:hypothetical protein
VARVSKTNYRPPDNGLGFSIGNDEQYECGYVTGLGMSAVSAEDLVAARATDGDRTERDEARDLKSILEAGPVDKAKVLKVTRSSGMSDRTVTRARGDLRVRSSARHDPNSGRLIAWQLALPDQSASQSTDEATPVRQPLIGAVGALVPTRENGLPQRPEGQPGESGTVESAPPPDDALFYGEEDGPIEQRPILSSPHSTGGRQ